MDKEFLEKDIINILKNRKNLLAFSAGVDSTALFFLLQEKGIEFDIAIVDYQLRKESKLEVEYAKDLAEKFNKKIFIKTAPITPPSIEKKARDIRYQFFKEIIDKYSYENLLTAHQLNDQLEWLLMQLTKGAGLVEILGMEKIVRFENYSLIRPLLYISKEELKNYLDNKKIKYFIDVSNEDINITRNYFRKEFSDKLIKKYKEGIKKSFLYLHQDKEILVKDLKFVKIDNLFIAKNQNSDIKNIRIIDKILKKLGYILSKNQKDEILKQKNIVIGSKFSISLNDKFIFISPFIKTKMEKEFREKCRVLKIPPNIRGYIYKEKIDLKTIQENIQQL
ncbi:tRNA lysidine(34) synthetase TilS [Nitrosophilus kaiyonis]|uniref:tRNA lysidine(34) synthetase TilS n=1 Tax=Nitrosophilus kaiyonis TaxID=2930200 RepID=UPI0024912406|nr:tRNA lysidine(34) synthetase TilS [Nitrosophilus kaiyonis]